MKLSVIIPARNEAPLIVSTVTRLRDYLDSVGITDLEILVVNDGSSDSTYEVVLAENRKDARIRVLSNTGAQWFRSRRCLWFKPFYRRRRRDLYGRRIRFPGRCRPLLQNPA